MTIAPSWSIIRRVRLAACVGFSEVVSAGITLSLAPPSELDAAFLVHLIGRDLQPPDRARTELAEPAGQRVGRADHDVGLLRAADARHRDRRRAGHQSLEPCSARDVHGFSSWF
jgi:hypothetical protein